VRGQLGLCHQSIGVGHGEGDDAARLLLYHDRRDQTGEVEEAVQVAGEHLAPACRRFIEHVYAMIGTRAVNEGIDATLPVENLADESRTHLGGRHVGMDG